MVPGKDKMQRKSPNLTMFCEKYIKIVFMAAFSTKSKVIRLLIYYNSLYEFLLALATIYIIQ